MPKRKKRKKIEHGAFSKLASFTSSAIKDYKQNQKLKQQQLEKELKKQEFSKLSLEKKELRAKEENFRKQEEKLRNIKSPIILKDFFINIDEILANANLAICRAGAGTIVDLINFKLPSILIPLPSSKDNHQFFNAKILAKHDLAIIIDQNNDDLDRAKRHIYETYSNAKKLESMNKKFDMIQVKNSNTLIYKLIINEN